MASTSTSNAVDKVGKVWRYFDAKPGNGYVTCLLEGSDKKRAKKYKALVKVQAGQSSANTSNMIHHLSQYHFVSNF